MVPHLLRRCPAEQAGMLCPGDCNNAPSVLLPPGAYRQRIKSGPYRGQRYPDPDDGVEAVCLCGAASEKTRRLYRSLPCRRAGMEKRYNSENTPSAPERVLTGTFIKCQQEKTDRFCREKQLRFFDNRHRREDAAQLFPVTYRIVKHNCRYTGLLSKRN